MTFEKGVTEIADSDDDPMTSSPCVVPDEAGDKHCAVSNVPYQERQDALHVADGLQQALPERDASTSVILGADLIDAPVDVRALRIDQTNMMLHETTAAQRGEGAAVEGGSHGLRLHTQKHPQQPESTARDTSEGPHVMVVSTEDGGSVAKEVESDPTAGGDEQQPPVSHANPYPAEQEVPEAIQLTMADAPLNVPGATALAPSEFSVDSEFSNGATCQSQSTVTRDSLPQESKDDPSPAVRHHLIDGHMSENVDHSLPDSTAASMQSNTTSITIGSPGDAGPATTMPDDYTSSTRHRAQDQADRPPDARMNTNTSEAATIENGTSSEIGQEQTSRSRTADQQPSVEEVASSKESANSSFGASSPIAQPSTHAQPHADAQRLSSPIPMPPSRTPQEITLDNLRAQKAALLASLGTLPAIQVLMEENALSDAESGDANDEPTETDIMAAANKIVKEHIKLLHEYNELKDVGQGLMGLIADQRGVRIVEVQEEFGIDAQD
ncbi:Swi5-domain-containing protein [Alternaria rosae]|uniref:Swi5-domain-containing protein n=2 Tax=Alternaria rosae TaxID=1187941 RepID=UPI001E8CAAA5|nr:Swi5-domain-containing protein [Alternaria rosae]KAH6866295.1 Swi5-domain-containing protein [Alternaria rosae]